MKKNKLINILCCAILSSCTNNNPINVNNNSEKYLDPISNTNKEISKNSDKDKKQLPSSDQIITKSVEDISKTTENINTLVTKPTENIDPLVTKPAENVDPLVTKPAENIDPDKITSITSGQGFTNIMFSQGKNEVNLNVSLSDFKVLATQDNSIMIESIDIVIKMNSTSNKTVSINKDTFINQDNLLISIKGLKDLDNLKIDLNGKDINSKVVSNKEVMNESLKGSKSINTTFSRKVSNITQNTKNTPAASNTTTQNTTVKSINSKL